MTRLLAVAVLGLAGCASAGPERPAAVGAAGAPTIRTQVNESRGYEFVISPDRRTISLDLEASADRVWGALMETYQSLGLPLSDIDTAARELGTRSHAIRRRLGREPLSDYIDCGSVLGASIANTYRVQLSVFSSLQALDPDRTRLVSRVSATASDPTSSSGPVTCASKGTLEREIATMIANGLESGG